MIPHALQFAAHDRARLHHLTVRVYVVLFGHLDHVAYRPLKRLLPARELGIAENQVSRAVEQLCAAGYLERGPNEGPPGRQVRTYRLAVSPKTAA